MFTARKRIDKECIKGAIFVPAQQFITDDNRALSSRKQAGDAGIVSAIATLRPNEGDDFYDEWW